MLLRSQLNVLYTSTVDGHVPHQLDCEFDETTWTRLSLQTPHRQTERLLVLFHRNHALKLKSSLLMVVKSTSYRGISSRERSTDRARECEHSDIRVKPISLESHCPNQPLSTERQDPSAC